MGSDGEALLARLERLLSPDAWRVLQEAVGLAERGGLELFLVGGAVRDLLLDTGHVDVDLVVEGDAIELASALAAVEPRARIVRHARFGTASFVGEGFRLDFAQARAEVYPRPGSLPEVRPALLGADLLRRDFSINAMALALTGGRSGRLIDPRGGRSDLRAKQVRILHDESFHDDPTRILRAIRYAGRLGFSIERRTARLLRRALPALARISGARLRREFEAIAAEEKVAAVLRLAGRCGALAAVHPALCASPAALRAAARLPACDHRMAMLLCLLLWDETPRTASAAAKRLTLTARQAGPVRAIAPLRRAGRRLAGASLRASMAVALLEPHPPAAIEALALMAREPLVARRARRYLDEWRHVRPALDGREVAALGVPRGPQIGRALARLREARLDGRVRTRDDEVALVSKMAGRRTKARG